MAKPRRDISSREAARRLLRALENVTCIDCDKVLKPEEVRYRTYCDEQGAELLPFCQQCFDASEGEETGCK